MVTRRYEDSGETYTGKDFGSVAANLGDATVEPFFAVDLMIDDTPIYLWTGVGELTVGDVTYTGGGNLLDVTTAAETGDIRATNATISVSGISASLLSVALQTKYHGRIARIKFGIGSSLTTLFIGYMDQMTINEGEDTSTISLAIESKLVDLERPRPIRYTTESQRIRFPNARPDLAFEFINDLQDKPVMWGRGVKL